MQSTKWNDPGFRNRQQRIDDYRKRQPLAELERKERKSKNRANLYTQEELDAAAVRAEIIWRKIKVE